MQVKSSAWARVSASLFGATALAVVSFHGVMPLMSLDGPLFRPWTPPWWTFAASSAVASGLALRAMRQRRELRRSDLVLLALAVLTLVGALFYVRWVAQLSEPWS